MEENFKSTIIEEGMYVDKDLTIGDRFNESNDINDYEKIKLSGPIYVNGNLTIRGVDLEANALIYVNGEVKILNSRIRGLNENGKEGSLIVLAKQPIEIANISSYQNEASKIRGFFYTEDEFEIFGVGSKIRIEGGVSAKKVVLNAIRGRAQRGVGFTGAQKILSGYEGTGYIKSPIYDYFESVIGQKRNNTESRLQIIYNPDIITTYSDLKEQEPTIT